MSTLTSTSRANFAKVLGKETRTFIDRCDGYSMRLSDVADSEKSAPLRQCLHATSAKIDELVKELSGMLGAVVS